MKTLKTSITIFIAMISFVAFSQTKNELTNVSYNETTVTNLKIEVNANSLTELEKSFKIKDLENVFTELDAEGDIEFIITCKKPSDYKLNSSKKISYKIVTNTKDKELFLKMSKRIYNAAKEYYKD